jgi:hypothetical protein
MTPALAVATILASAPIRLEAVKVAALVVTGVLLLAA